MLSVLPGLTAAGVIVCAVVSIIRPAIRPLLWSVLALTVLNLALAPFTSGEWSYQRAEAPAYDQALMSGDFSALDQLTADHDRFRLHKMIAVAAGLLGAMAALATVGLRADRGAVRARTPIAVAAGLVGVVSLAVLTLFGIETG